MVQVGLRDTHRGRELRRVAAGIAHELRIRVDRVARDRDREVAAVAVEDAAALAGDGNRAQPLAERHRAQARCGDGLDLNEADADRAEREQRDHEQHAHARLRPPLECALRDPSGALRDRLQRGERAQVTRARRLGGRGGGADVTPARRLGAAAGFGTTGSGRARPPSVTVGGCQGCRPRCRGCRRDPSRRSGPRAAAGSGRSDRCSWPARDRGASPRR